MLHAVLWNRYIYCGSGSYFGKVLVPVPVPYPNLFITVFQQQKHLYKIAFSMLELHCFPESWPLIIYFLTPVLPFMMDPGSNPAAEPDLEYMLQFRFR